MTQRERSKRIKAAAAGLGFDRCGIAPAGPIARADVLARWLADGSAGTMAYLRRHEASRIDLRAWLPWARSVIVVALNYAQLRPASKRQNVKTSKRQKVRTSKSQNHDNRASPRHPTGATQPSNPQSSIVNPQSSIRNPQSPIPNLRPLRGRVAMYAWGEDYHLVVRDKLDALVARMREMFSEPMTTRVCVDTSAITERELAAAAGIGWIGKNTMVLHQTLGSFFFLGEIITDLELSPDDPEPDRCGTCTRCLDACPTRAFPEPHRMDARKCISYLTIEHRGDIDPALAAGMDDWVFGCDVCQTVCPYNRHGPLSTNPRFTPARDTAAPELEDILGWDETAYRAHGEGGATGRATLAMWKRNAAIAQKNLTT